MAGLLDFIKTPEGQGLLAGAFAGMAGAQRGTPWNNVGRAGVAGLAGYQNANDQILKDETTRQMNAMRQNQLDQYKRQNEALASLEGSMPEHLRPLSRAFPELAVQHLLPKPVAPQLVTVNTDKGPMQRWVRPGESSGVDLGAPAPKDEGKPSDIKAYEYAKAQGYQGSFVDFQSGMKRAGASNVSVKVDSKMGESLAGQVGPIAKDSRIQTQGAVKMFDAADRLEKALDSNKVTSGPFATQIQTAKQLAQVVGGGNDAGIRQTQQAIKSLAQMAVEARKQLQGQGQVTESEAAAVAKADAGNLNELTTGELRDLVVLTKRAAHYQAKAHSDLMGTMGGKQETSGLVPYYNVQGLDPLLKHSPSLPQINNGGWGIKEVK